MKNNISKDNIDPVDEMLFNLAKKDCEPIPEDIHNNIIKTINSIDFDTKSTKRTKIKKLPKISFNRIRGTVIASPIRLVAITFLLVILIGTGIVGARNISEKFFNKDTVRLNGIGIANEFIFTEEIEGALKQNVPLNLIQLDDNYYINVHSILLDEINFFTVFELHSKSGVTDDLRFNINDLKVTDESGTILYNSYSETNYNANSGYNHIYNRENSIKELFFMFGYDSSKIKELNFSFSNIQIYRYDKELIKDSSFADIDLTTDLQNITVPITKDNYNTIQEYVLLDENINNKYYVQKVLLTNTGLYILAECSYDASYPIIKNASGVYAPTYRLPLKRTKANNTLMLYAYNIKHVIDNNITIYSELDKEGYNLIAKN